MSKSIISSIAEENPYSNLIIFENGKYIAFGHEQFSDLVKIGSAKKVKNKSVYVDGDILSPPESTHDGLYDKIHELYDPALLGSLRIKSYQVKFIQKTVKIFNATHLKFYGNEDGIFVNFFDILRSIPEARMNRKHETRLLFHKLKDSPVEPFEMTFNAGSFGLLPVKSFHIGFGDNNVGIFTEDDSEEVYLLRDPEVNQPVIHTFSDRLQQGISFVLPANASLVNLDTNQHENLELDFEDFQ